MKSREKSQPGIYVEIRIRESVERVWQLTQDPALHERWDLRFDRICYLPRGGEDEPQRFLYETRIGFGLSIRGTGESVGERSHDGERTSSLRFASDDRKSLIREGSGYWRYIPGADGTRFFTWYDYEVRFGAVGRWFDRAVFRPLMGWATAWSFDRLRLWAEDGQSPEISMTFSMIHAVARIAIAFIWVWHGLVPKLIFQHIDERRMLGAAGVPLYWLPWIGVGEIAIGVAILVTWHVRTSLIGNAVLMVLATLVVAATAPAYLCAAFNPVTLNLAVIALSAMGWLASGRLPTARRCLRRDPRVQS